METTVILRTILYQAKRAKTKEEVVRAIEVMCTKDDIASVEQVLAGEKNEKKEC